MNIITALIAIAAIFCVSCQIVGSAITGQAIPATAVQRAGHDESEPVLVSSSDLDLAEQSAEAARLAGAPAPVNGLYDVGAIAARAREVAIETFK